MSTPIKYTCTNLAEHLDGMSHDAITDYLSHARLTARQVWQMVEGLIQDGPDAFLIVDDGDVTLTLAKRRATVCSHEPLLFITFRLQRDEYS